MKVCSSSGEKVNNSVMGNFGQKLHSNWWQTSIVFSAAKDLTLLDPSITERVL